MVITASCEFRIQFIADYRFDFLTPRFCQVGDKRRKAIRFDCRIGCRYPCLGR